MTQNRLGGQSFPGNKYEKIRTIICCAVFDGYIVLYGRVTVGKLDNVYDYHRYTLIYSLRFVWSDSSLPIQFIKQQIIKSILDYHISLYVLQTNKCVLNNVNIIKLLNIARFYYQFNSSQGRKTFLIFWFLFNNVLKREIVIYHLRLEFYIIFTNWFF